MTITDIVQRSDTPLGRIFDWTFMGPDRHFAHHVLHRNLARYSSGMASRLRPFRSYHRRAFHT